MIMCDCVHAHEKCALLCLGNSAKCLWCSLWVSGFPSFPSSILLGCWPTVPSCHSFELLKLLKRENFCFTMWTHQANLLRRIFCQWSCISLTNLVKLQHADSLSKRPNSDSTDNCSTAQFHWPLSTNCWIWQLCEKNKYMFIMITTDNIVEQKQ